MFGFILFFYMFSSSTTLLLSAMFTSSFYSSFFLLIFLMLDSSEFYFFNFLKNYDFVLSLMTGSDFRNSLLFLFLCDKICLLLANFVKPEN